jgi:hypothetical protein
LVSRVAIGVFTSWTDITIHPLVSRVAIGVFTSWTDITIHPLVSGDTIGVFAGWTDTLVVVCNISTQVIVIIAKERILRPAQKLVYHYSSPVLHIYSAFTVLALGLVQSSPDLQSCRYNLEIGCTVGLQKLELEFLLMGV